MRATIYDYPLEELKNLVKPPFRAKQIYSWLYHNYVSSFDDMQNIPKTLRAELNEKYENENEFKEMIDIKSQLLETALIEKNELVNTLRHKNASQELEVL